MNKEKIPIKKHVYVTQLQAILAEHFGWPNCYIEKATLGWPPQDVRIGAGAYCTLEIELRP